MAMKLINTLVNDISEVLLHPTEASAAHIAGVGSSVAKAYMKTLNRGLDTDTRDPKVLYASEIGNKCARQIKYKLTMPHLADPLTASTKFKFLYGDMIESALVGLVKMAGHVVELEQETVQVNINGYTIRGRMDCVIDGHFIDVKSTTSFGFNEFKANNGHLKFGYGDQLNFYKLAHSAKLPSGIGKKEETYFLAADKQLGHICLSENRQPMEETAKKIADLTETLDNPLEDIERLPVISIGASGNEGLCTECSYCPFKKECYTGLRAFAYSNKVEFLTKVVKEPKVVEINLGS